MELTVGAQVTPSIRLVQLLGEGGMGSVWIADHQGLSTRVAVKFVIDAGGQRGAHMRERFKREASLAAQIKSPHVVQIFDHGQTDSGTPFIVMELLQGESLEERLARAGALAPFEVVLLVRQVAQVLAAAHELGIIHRDIKPANVFLVQTPYDLFIKVLDFGIAKDVTAPLADGMTATGSMLGSPRFMSPEQINDAKGADGRCDLWALTSVAYEASTGQHSFAGDTLGDLIVSVMSARYLPPSQLGRGLSAGLDGFFARGFHADVSQRFQTAAELTAALEQALQGAPAATPQTAVPTMEPTATAPQPAVTTPRGTPWMAIAGAALALCLVVGGALSWYALTPSTEQSSTSKRSKKAKKKKQKGARAKDRNWTPGSGSPYAESDSCPFKLCKPLATDEPARFEPLSALPKANRMAAEAAAGAELTMINAPETAAGVVDLTEGHNAQFHYRHSGGRLVVYVTHGALMLEQEEMIPAIRKPVTPPQCRMHDAWKAAVAGGLPRKAVTQAVYLGLPAFPGKPARSVWQLTPLNAPTKMWRVEGTECELVERP